jgi:hypothetical protein|nr:MAG TPA: hypothetical protein [Caudoviricetes sp.]
MADKPVTREEKYLAYLTGDYTGEIPKPITRKEKYLYELCLKGIGGEISPEEIKAAVNEYLEKNPVKPGATTEQAQQIEQNKTDVASLKEDLSNKITKFYASNQGETHITDSDNGKTQDMMLYGKSEQKQYRGKNLINSDEYYSKYKQNDGTYKGKASEFNKILVPISKYIGTQITVSCKVTVPLDTTSVLIEATINGAVTKGNRIESGKSEVIALTISPRTESDTIKITYGDGGNGIVVASEFQIEKGSEVTPYEPYVGGQPSPSPDYPQEIKSVVNPTVKVCGKNLLPFPYRDTSKTQNGVTFDVQNDGTIHIYGTASAVTYFNFSTNIECGSESFSNTNEKYKLVGNLFYNASNKVLSYVVREGTTCDFILKPMVVLKNETDLTYEPYHEQTVTLPYTLNAIPVSSGGNVTIDRQQYIADYVDAEHGKLVKMVDSSKLDNTQSIIGKIEWLLAEPQEIDLTQEEVQALKALATYYPTTNISVNSKQLDGYAVFNYPISIKNGWNYVKQQIGDTRDYIYDMDARSQDTDLQAAEAYVNSEYAVALTELEV